MQVHSILFYKLENIGAINKMKRILVTGSAGFVGANFVDYILEKTDWEIVGLDSLRHMGDSQRIVYNPRFKHLTHDLNAPISPVLELLITMGGGIDYIVNIASESAIDRSISDPKSVVLNNVNLMLNVLDLAKRIKVKNILHLSTDEVYGQYYDAPHKEWSNIVPSNPYSASKAAQEAIGISYWRTYNVPLTIVNCQNMFGKMQNVEKFIPKTIKYILEDKVIPIYSNNGVSGSRKYTHVRNLCSAIKFILDREVAMYTGAQYLELPDRYNVSGGEEIDNIKLVEAISQIIGKKANIVFVDEVQIRPGYDRKYALDDEKLRSLGWNPEINFRESLVELVKWSIDNAHWLQ